MVRRTLFFVGMLVAVSYVTLYGSQFEQIARYPHHMAPHPGTADLVGSSRTLGKAESYRYDEANPLHILFTWQGKSYADSFAAFKNDLLRYIESNLRNNAGAGSDQPYHRRPIALYLTGNRLGNLRPENFRAFMQELHDHVRSLGSTIVYLDLSNNGLYDLPVGTLQGFDRLRELDLHANQLKVLHAGSLQDLPNLGFLYLNANNLQRLDPGSFTGLENLRGLDLSSNRLLMIEPETFHGLNSLKRLYLQHNSIAELHVGCFDGLPMLTHLILSHNPLSEADAFAFGRLPNLKKLDLAGTNLSDETIALIKHQVPPACNITESVLHSALSRFFSWP